VHGATISGSDAFGKYIARVYLPPQQTHTTLVLVSKKLKVQPSDEDNLF
jgi:hypothetical protein